MRAFGSDSAVLVLLIVALAGPTFASHCYSCTVSSCESYCCSMGCDSPHNPNGNTCAQAGQVTEASIWAIASSDGCSPLISGSCSYAPPIAQACIGAGRCPPSGCAAGVIATPGPVPPPSPPTSAPTYAPTQSPLCTLGEFEESSPSPTTSRICAGCPTLSCKPCAGSTFQPLNLNVSVVTIVPYRAITRARPSHPPPPARSR